MKLLALDTTTTVRSVALIEDGSLIAENFHDSALPHSAFLCPMIRDSLAVWRLTLSEIDLFVVVHGPGSFTGVRVAVTTAKTLAFISRKPIVAVGSLETLAYPLNQLGHTVCTLLDARKKELYVAHYAPAGNQDQELLSPPATLTVKTLPDTLPENYFITGTGLAVYATEIKAKFPLNPLAPKAWWHPRASAAGILAYHRVQAGRLNPIEDFNGLSRLAPLYLRKPEAEINWEKKFGTVG